MPQNFKKVALAIRTIETVTAIPTLAVLSCKTSSKAYGKVGKFLKIYLNIRLRVFMPKERKKNSHMTV